MDYLRNAQIRIERRLTEIQNELVEVGYRGQIISKTLLPLNTELSTATWMPGCYDESAATRFELVTADLGLYGEASRIAVTSIAKIITEVR